MESKFNIHAKIVKLHTAKNELPKLLAETGQTYFQQNFNKSQWDGVAWKPRKEGTSYAKKMEGKHLLVNTGKLRRALQNTIDSFNWQTIKWQLKGVPYGGFVNFGTSGKVKEHQKYKTITTTVMGSSGFVDGVWKKGKKKKLKLHGDAYTVKSHLREMPPRQFMGIDKGLKEKLRKKIETEFNKIMAHH